MAVKSLHVFFSGYEAGVDKGFFTFRVDEGKKIDSSYLCFLVKTDEGNILIDTGPNPDDVAEMRKLTGGNITIKKEDTLPERLKTVGLSPSDVNVLIMSHLHWDHSGFITQLPRAEVIVQKEEHRFAFDPPPYVGFYIPARFNSPKIKWKQIDGDYILMPGISIIFTPGHTPGCQSVMVDLPKSGPVIIAGDAGFLQDNFQRELIPVYFGNPRQALYSIKRLNTWAKVRNAQIFTTHDIELYQKMKKPPEAYT